MESPPRILVVEDDESFRYVVSRLMRLPGYEVLEAMDGQQCLRLAREKRPELVLLDVRLPDMSGVEVCKRLKADPELARTLVLLISGVETSPERQADALDEGADGYLIKPVHERALLAHVRAMFRIRRAEKALVDQQEHELRSLGLQAHGAGGAQPALSARQPAQFTELLERYGVLMDRAVEARGYKVKYAPSEPLRELAEQLGDAGVGARDVVELHAEVLKRRTQGATVAKVQAYVEEGRLLALELMGNLVTYYRGRR